MGFIRGRNLTDFLVLINIAIFLYLIFMPDQRRLDIFSNYAFSLQSFLGGKYWTPVTSMFLHGSVSHIILNMISLFFFGRALELDTGVSKLKFLSIYFIGGIIASFFAAFTQPFDQLSVGASGAIFSVIAAAMIIKPFEFVAFPYILPIPIVFVATIMIVSNFIFFAAPPEGSNISFAAHIGGFVVGLFFGFKQRGMRKSLGILMIAAIIFLIAAKYLNIISLLDYTQYIQKAAS